MLDDDEIAPDAKELVEEPEDEPNYDEVPKGYLVEVPPPEPDDDEPSADEFDVTDDEVPDDAALRGGGAGRR